MSLCTVEIDYLFGEFQRSTVSADLRCSLSLASLTLPFADRLERIFQPSEVWHYFANRA